MPLMFDAESELFMREKYSGGSCCSMDFILRDSVGCRYLRVGLVI